MAQTAAAQPPERLDPVVLVGAGTAQRATAAPFAVSVVDEELLRGAGPLINLSEALGRVPGLLVANRQNFAQDLQISSRGFGARASFGVRGLRLYTDGIAASGPDGQGQVSHFDLAGAARVEVLRGPFSALYGNAAGGVIALVSRAPETDRSEWAWDTGSDGLQQGRMRVERRFNDGWSLRAGLSAMQLDGPRPQSAAQRQLASLRLGREGDGERWVLHLNHLRQPAQDPLGLSRAQLEADPRQTTPQALQFDTRKAVTQSQAGLQWQGGGVQLAAYAGRRAVTQWQAIPVATQANPRHPGGVIDFERRYQGLDLRWLGEIGPMRTVVGVALDSQQEERRGFENFIGSRLGVTGALRRDERNTVQGRDLYAQFEWPWSAALHASAGLRSSRMALRSADRYLGNGDDSGRLRFSALNPVAALRWQPSPAWNVYASVARGAETPTLGELAYRPDGQPGFNAGLAAQRSHLGELGLKWRGAAGSVQLAAFRTETTAEIAVQSNQGGRSTFRNLGPTTREGLELEARWAPAPGWLLEGSAAVLSAKVTAPFLACSGTPCTQPSLPVPAGARVAGTQPRSSWLSLSRRTPGWLAALELRGQGRTPVNDANSDFAPGFVLPALRLSAERGPWQVLLRVDNLFDRRTVGSVIVNEGNQRFFEPAPGRSGWLGLRYSGSSTRSE